MEAIIERNGISGEECCPVNIPSIKVVERTDNDSDIDIRSFIQLVTGSDFFGNGGLVLK